MLQVVLSVLVCCVCCIEMKAQSPVPSNQAGTVQALPLDGSKGSTKSANLPGLDFYEAVVTRILSGTNEGIRVFSWQKKGDPPKPQWYVQVHVAPSFTEDSLFVLSELTDGSVELVMICPRGGINFW